MKPASESWRSAVLTAALIRAVAIAFGSAAMVHAAPTGSNSPAAAVSAVANASGSAEKYFAIEVVDSRTGRGVPMVELETVNGVRYYTDSNGLVALLEPGLMNQRVFFYVRSHGYQFPKDGFGMRGTSLQVVPGGKAQLKIHRVNIAERLYRITGEGIYRDSVLLGRAVAIARPLLNGQVLGQDSVLTAVYCGKLYWFWGDTQQPAHPLGNFHACGAISELPGSGGLDPQQGVQLEYFVDQEGKSRPMAPMAGEGPTWIEALAVLRDQSAKERLYAIYVKVRPNSLDVYRRGIAVFDDAEERFQHLADWPMDSPIQPAGHTFKHTEDGVEYVYFAFPVPVVRVRANTADFCRPDAYQAYTCLQPAATLSGRNDPTGFKPSANRLDRSDDGRVRWGWKASTAPVSPQQQASLINSGVLKPSEALLHLQDPDSGKPLLAHRGSVYWNAYRQRWVMIVCEQFGTSVLGEIWYAEADTPLGPWVYARKIVTHEKQSFYNPKQHPEFDKLGGRIIFFEGTYTHTFSGNPERTPRYDYNQMMYKLDLADERLVLPVPVYRFVTSDRTIRWAAAPQAADARQAEVAFFALDRPRPGCVAIAATSDKSGVRLKVQPVEGATGASDKAQGFSGDKISARSDQNAQAIFFALPADMASRPATTVPLFEYRSKVGSQHTYATADNAPAGYVRAEKPLCLVWRNPIGPGVLPEGLLRQRGPSR